MLCWTYARGFIECELVSIWVFFFGDNGACIEILKLVGFSDRQVG